MVESTPKSMEHDPNVLEERDIAYKKAQERIRKEIKELLGKEVLKILDGIVEEGELSLQKTVAYLMSFIPPGRVDHELFIQEQRRSVETGIELVPLRRNKETLNLEVLLLPRDKDDEFWPGQLHVPGTIRLSGDEDEMLWKRLFRGELKNIKTSEPVFIGNLFQRTRRGDENMEVFFVEILQGEHEEGTFYPVDELPENIVSHHRTVIALATKHHKLTRLENE